MPITSLREGRKGGYSRNTKIASRIKTAGREKKESENIFAPNLVKSSISGRSNQSDSQKSTVKNAFNA